MKTNLHTYNNHKDINKATIHLMMTGVRNKNSKKSSINDIKTKRITITNKINPNQSIKRKTLFSMILNKSKSGYKPEKEIIQDPEKKH